MGGRWSRARRRGWATAAAALLPLLAAGPGAAQEEAPPAPAASGETAAPAETPPAVVRLSLADLLRAALERSPLVLGDQAREEMLRAVPAQSSALPPPSIGVTVMGFPATLMDGFEIRYTAQQTLPLGDQLEQRAEAATAKADEAGADIETRRLDVVLQVRLAWLAVGEALAEALVIDDQSGTMQDMARIANRAYAAGVGMGSQADALRAHAELPMLDDQHRMTDAAAESARAALAATAALEPGEAPADPQPLDIHGYEAPALPSIDELVAQALARRPELAAVSARAEAAEADVRAAAGERDPDLMLMGGVQQRVGGNMPPVAFMLGVSMTLPWAQGDSHDAAEAEARAEGRMVRSDGDALRLSIESDLRQLVASYAQLADGLDSFRRTIRNLRAAENAAVTAYTAGTGEFDAILGLEARLLDARRGLVRYVYQLEAVRARIDRVIAKPVDEQIAQAEATP